MATTAPDGSTPYLLAFSDHNGTKSTGPDGTYCLAALRSGVDPNLQDHARVMEEFKRTVKPDAEITAYISHDWSNDPMAGGQWSCWKGDAMSRYLRELQKPHGRVFLSLLVQTAQMVGGGLLVVLLSRERTRRARLPSVSVMVVDNSMRTCNDIHQGAKSKQKDIFVSITSSLLLHTASY